MNEVITSGNLVEFVGPVDADLEPMLKAGVHLGHIKSKNHPSMKESIFGVRNTISIIDLTKTKEKLAAASDFLEKISSRGGVVLLVGTRPAAQKAIRNIAEKTQMPYFVERWIGGTLTNFKVITRRIEYMESMERAKASGDFEKYTKKERMKKEEELEKLRKNFDGVRTLKRLPDALFIVDIIQDETAINEAKKIKIPVVALVDTNSNAKLVEWPIPSNDDALPAVTYMTDRVGEAILRGQKIWTEKREVKPEEKSSKPTV